MSQLEFIFGTQVIPFPADRFFVGSGADCLVRVTGADVQAHHAEVMKESDGTWWVRDISGSGSVRVDGSATWESQLQGGSFLSVGRIELSVRERAGQGSGTVKTRSGGVPAHRLATELESPAAKPDDITVPPTRSLRRGEVMTTPARPQAEVLDATAMRQGPPPSPPKPKPPKRNLEPGDVIENRYRIVKRLAAGGMGEVYEAEHVELHKPVAVKVMLPDLSKDAEFVTRFKREAVASSRIGQHNIVDISDFGRTAEGRFYFVMELLDGRTLASHVREGAFAQRRAVNVVIQIARALMAAHDRGIVHRDLKPENVMLLQRPGQPDFVKVLDFGIAKVNEGHGAGGLTQIGMVVGTPQYMSPEQAAGLPVDSRTDVYSLGLMLYEIITGRPTFKGETPSMLMAMQMTAAPPPLSPGPVELPIAPELEKLIFHMLQKKPGDRPQSMHEVVERLEPFSVGPITASRPSMAPTTGNLGPAPSTLTPLPRGGTKSDAPSATPAPLPAAAQGLAAPPMPAPPSTLHTPTPVLARQPSTEPVPAMAQAQATPPSQVKKIVLVFAVCLVLAIMMGVAAAGLINGQQPAPAQPPIVVAPPPPAPEVEKKLEAPPPPQKVTLHFTTRPDGAEVYEGDALLGTTPLNLARAPEQSVMLRFELKGHKPVTRKVRFEDGASQVLIELEKNAKPSGPRKPPPPESDPNGLKSLPE